MPHSYAVVNQYQLLELLAPHHRAAGVRVSVVDAGVVILGDGAALSVSAPHGRSRETSHVIDPRCGEPTTERALAAVVSTSAAHADAWSTALLVGGSPPSGLAALIVEGGRVTRHGPDGVFVSE